MRSFNKFSYRDAVYNIYSDNFGAVKAAIVKQREILEKYILNYPDFLHSLAPIPPLPEYSPEITKIMQQAGTFANVGPMAAVAGAIAQLAAESGNYCGERGNINAGEFSRDSEVIVENGGDIFMVLKKELILGIYTDAEGLKGKLAFRILPEDTPLAVCSSSSTMGHSVSLGKCNLSTVFSRSGALADAAATRACNMVKSVDDIQHTLDEISALPGISGLMIIKGNKVGVAGDLPELISNADPDIMNKITRSLRYNFF